MGNFIILLDLLTHFNFVLVHPLFIVSLSQLSCFFCIHYCKWVIFETVEKLIVARFDESITTYDPSIGEILFGNNKESENRYFVFMNPFLSFKTRVFFSEGNLESYSYVLISLIFVHYLVSHSAYIFLYFLSNFKLFDSLLEKDWWYTSTVTMIISLKCI